MVTELFGTCTEGISCASYFSYLLSTISNDVTGSVFLTLLGVFIIFYVLLLLAGVPNDLALLLLTPFAIIGTFVSPAFSIIIGMIMFYLAFRVAMNLW